MLFALALVVYERMHRFPKIGPPSAFPGFIDHKLFISTTYRPRYHRYWDSLRKAGTTNPVFVWIE